MSKRLPKSSKKRAKFLETLESRTMLASTLVITKGGTYTGSWESQSAGTPAVLVNTSEPVVILNSTITGRGDLIASGVDHTDITVKNVKGYGLNPNVYGRAPGRFLTVENFDNVDVQDSYLENTAGIYMLNYAGDHTAAETVKVTDNQAKNIDGRKSDGAGGWLDFNTRTNKSTGKTEDGFELMQFVQFDKVLNVSGIEIGWNQVINLPGQSRVEDNISIYKSSGTSSSPILIHDNYIDGAYTIKPWQGDTSDSTYNYDWSFSGGGIMLGDGVGSSAATDPAFVKAYNNTIVSTTNYGIALSAGHDLEAYNNRVLSAGVLPDGRKIANQNVGIYVWDSYGAGPSHFFKDITHDNLSGWVQGSGRNDWWSPTGSTVNNNTHWSGTITAATETAELATWQAKLAAHTGTPTTPPTTPPLNPSPTDPTQSDPLPTDPTPTDPTPTDPVPPIDFPTTPTDPTPQPPVDQPIPQIDFSGTIFNDVDGDGVRDAGEAGISGRRVYADANDNSKYDAGETSTLTDSSGHFALQAASGATIRQEIPTGWYQSVGGSLPAANTSASAPVSVNFGATKFGKIAGNVFDDANRNRAQDTGEAGLAGWSVFIDANNNGWWDKTEVKAATDAAGNWSFGNLRAGIYNVRIIQKDRTMTRTGASYFKHRIFSGTEITGDQFTYA
jgi:uncharacterized protein (DUF2141 family)